MNLVQRRAAAGLACLGLASSLVVAGPAAFARPCEPYYDYKLSSTATRMPFSNVPTFKNGPGGTLSVTKSYSGSVSFQVTAGAESEVGAVLAKAKVSVSASITKTNETGTTNTYSRKITAGKFGHAQYVSWGKRIVWKKVYIRADCSSTTVDDGVIRFPTSEEGWYYWETAS